MFEIILGIGVCVVMAKIASQDNESGVIWFCVTFALCLGASYSPLPFLRFLIAGGVAFGLMIAYKMIAKK